MPSTFCNTKIHGWGFMKQRIPAHPCSHSGWQMLSLECKWRVEWAGLTPCCHFGMHTTATSPVIFLHQICLSKDHQPLLRHNNVWHPSTPPLPFSPSPSTSRQMGLSLKLRATPMLTYTLGEAAESLRNTPSYSVVRRKHEHVSLAAGESSVLSKPSLWFQQCCLVSYTLLSWNREIGLFLSWWIGWKCWSLQIDKDDLDKNTSFAQWKIIQKNSQNHSSEEGWSVRGGYSGFSGSVENLSWQSWSPDRTVKSTESLWIEVTQKSQSHTEDSHECTFCFTKCPFGSNVYCVNCQEMHFTWPLK